MLIARIGAELIAGSGDRAVLDALGQLLATSLEPLTARARAAGDLRADIDGRRLGLALRMIGGLLPRPHAGEEDERQLNEAIDLVFDGIRPH